jgi:hypothetical protein
MAVNVYDELKNALTQVKTVLDEGTEIIRPAIQAIAAAVPEVNDLLSKLIELLASLKTEVQKLDVSMIPVDKVLPFLNGVKTLLESGRKILPEEDQGKVDTALEVVGVVATIPTPEQIKAEITALIDAVSAQVASLQAP